MDPASNLGAASLTPVPHSAAFLGAWPEAAEARPSPLRRGLSSPPWNAKTHERSLPLALVQCACSAAVLAFHGACDKCDGVRTVSCL